MKWRLPQFSMRVLVIAMLLFGAGLGLVGRELFQIRTRAEKQREFVEQLKNKGVRIVEEDRKDLTILESLVVWMEGSQGLSIVSKVSLREGTIHEDDLAQIAVLQGLREIEDHGVHLNDNALELLGQNPTLRRVSLVKGWTGSGNGATKLISGNAPLEEILLDESPVNDTFFEFASRLPSLTYLQCNAINASPNAIKVLANSSKLKGLNLKNAEGLSGALSVLASNPAFRDLWLYDYTFRGGELEAIKSADQIEGIVITTKQFPRGTMGALAEMKKLKAIGLFGELDDDEQCIPFQSPQLEIFGVEGLKKPSKGLVDCLAKCGSLQRILLVDVPLTDAELEKFAVLKGLKSIAIGPGPTSEAVSRLQKSVPQCTVASRQKDGRIFAYKPGGQFEIRQPPPLVQKAGSEADNTPATKP